MLIVVALRFVKLVNFMDGIGWMTAAKAAPAADALALLGMGRHIPVHATLVRLRYTEPRLACTFVRPRHASNNLD
jgi:hypothetical protein